MHPTKVATAFVASLLAVHAATAAQFFVNMQSDGGQWVCAEGGGGGKENGSDAGYPRGRVVADRAGAGLWEEFILNDINGGSLTDGDTVTLRTRGNGQFVSAEGGGGGRVIANRPLEGSYERFTIKKMNGTGTIGNNDQIALQVNNGKWMCADGGGGYPLVADRTSPGGWETFTIVLSNATPSTYWTSPSYSPTIWNDDPPGVVQLTNNCYNYGSNRITGTKAQPGTASGYPILIFSAFALDLGLYKDGFENTTKFGTSSENKMKMYVCIWPNTDFHFYRKDSNGMWSGKPGTTAATDLDNSGNTISDPSNADRGEYTTEVGYYFSPCVSSNQGDSLANIR